jgi:hypothetical protein
MVKRARLIFLGFLLTAASLGYSIQAGAQAKGSDRFEVTSIKAVRPTLAKTVAALKKGDIAAAKAAFDEYDSEWTGIEVYINTRDKAMYTDMEQNLQAEINKGFAMPNPDAAALLADTQMLLAKYDDAIAMVEKGEPLNPLYDDVARLRIVRANLRDVTAGLKAGDMAKARKAYSAFDHKWSGVENLIKSRSQDAYNGVTKDMAQIKSALAADKPDADPTGALVKDLTDKYNTVVTDVTKDARAQK